MDNDHEISLWNFFFIFKLNAIWNILVLFFFIDRCAMNAVIIMVNVHFQGLLDRLTAVSWRQSINRINHSILLKFQNNFTEQFILFDIGKWRASRQTHVFNPSWMPIEQWNWFALKWSFWLKYLFIYSDARIYRKWCMKNEFKTEIKIWKKLNMLKIFFYFADGNFGK